MGVPLPPLPDSAYAEGAKELPVHKGPIADLDLHVSYGERHLTVQANGVTPEVATRIHRAASEAFMEQLRPQWVAYEIEAPAPGFADRIRAIGNSLRR